MKQKIPIIWKKGSSKSCLELNSPRKSQGRTCQSPPRVELGGREDWYGWNIMYKNSELYTLQGWMLQKIPISWKKGSSKSFLELNSLQKSHWAHMSISLRNGARRLERLIWLKYYYVQKQQIIFTLRLNAAKNTNFIKKASSKSCLELNSLQKNHGCTCLFPPGVKLGGSKDWHVWSIRERRKIDWLQGSNATGNTNYMKENFK